MKFQEKKGTSIPYQNKEVEKKLKSTRQNINIENWNILQFITVEKDIQTPAITPYEREIQIVE